MFWFFCQDASLSQYLPATSLVLWAQFIFCTDLEIIITKEYNCIDSKRGRLLWNGHNKKASWSFYPLPWCVLHSYIYSFSLSVHIWCPLPPQLHFLSYIGLFSFLQILPPSSNVDMTFSSSDSSKSTGMLDDYCLLPLLATVNPFILTHLCSRPPLLLAWSINFE